ncbi:MAG: hypothetical protein AB7C91_03535 [Sphaerochaeta sp.]|jgi:hypothetical protein|uniref:hypothetical protein n=1 Tax=Sphaerochaeta sp. TaxID=1972642 RepID=UPI003D10ED81
MKRRRTAQKPGRANPGILIVLLLLLGFLLSLPFFLWLLTPEQNLTVTVYDKSVPNPSSHAHHEALAWLLLHDKYPTASGTLFDKRITYLGYHPQLANPIQDLSGLDDRTDVLYIADTYGVYRKGEGFIRNQTAGESNLIWGGSSAADAQALRTLLNREQSSTVIAEYNSFATPTPSYVQSQLYELLGTRWSGWTGMYLQDLSLQGEIPPWIKEKYGQNWQYQGKGILLSNIDEEIVVLREGIELGADAMTFSYTEQGRSELGLTGSVNYRQIFDITEPMEGTEVLATYSLNVNPSGSARLQAFGLTSTFPAIQSKTTANHKAYYLSGNWAYWSNPLRFARIKGMEKLMQRFAPKEDSFLWDTYLPLLSAIFKEAEQRKQMVIAPLEREVTVQAGTKLVARATQHALEIYQDGSFKPIFLYGINLGTAMPGRWFTEFPKDKSLYFHWLEQMGELGVNTLRIYTLLDPQFYQAFALYNRIHTASPIYLLQEVWPEEQPPGHDYLTTDYQKAFEAEIEHVVDAIHGSAQIDERQGRAWGNYTTDVSSFVIGYLVGRELEPEEVEMTDKNHKGYRFIGQYLGTTQNASPTESWLAQSGDYLLSYEERTYGWQHAVSLVNWPTLDYLAHESERDEEGKKINEYNDRATVDINHLTLGPNNKAGLFGSYHIYPNYPDFMNNDPAYDSYEDAQGRLRYGGYLKAFMEGHRNYPAVVAEFGIATGMGNAHTSPDGYNHGGLSEEEQAKGIIRMFEAMKREGYSGGIIFEWMDEWAKKTWTTEPFMIPYDRQILWHNAIDPEQNYGILAYEAVKPARSTATLDGSGLITRMEGRSDASYLWIDLTLSGPLNFGREQLRIGIDTLFRERGELRYLPDLATEAPSGMEYQIVLDSFDQSRLLAIKEADYTHFGFSTATGLKREGTFQTMSKLINKKRALSDGTIIAPRFEDSSHLRYGDLTGSTNHWMMEGNQVTIRIPWTRINVSDPSSASVLDDQRIFYSDPLRDQLSIRQTDAIVLSALVTREGGQTPLDQLGPVFVMLQHWNQPVYQQRLKQSYQLLHAYFTQEEQRND